MKHYFFVSYLLIGTMLILSSCSKISESYINESEIIPIWSEQDALRDFSLALSKVVSTNENVRNIIKENALIQFDNDYDVYWENIKNKSVDNDITISNLIQTALGNQVSISEIESIIPTLTIYVTDARWLDPQGFCAENWNVSDRRVAVTFPSQHNTCEYLYANGSCVGKIEPYTIPGGPVLIVKKNERVRAISETKADSNGKTYEFIADAFNPQKNDVFTKGNYRHTGSYSSSWVAGQTPGDNSALMSAAMLNEINPDIITAFNYFDGSQNAVHNDFIYYGMTPENPEGLLRNDVRTRLTRFKIYPSAFNTVVDEVGIDRKYSGDYWETDDNGKGYSAEPSLSTIYSKLWSDGNLEIQVKVFQLSSSGTEVALEEDTYNVPVLKLFTVKNQSIKKEQWGTTLTKWYITWRYTIIKRDESTLAEKWYYPEHSIDFPTWDLVNNSAYTVLFIENDTSTTSTKTTSVTSKRANSTTLSGDETNSLGVKIEEKLGDLNLNKTIKHGLGWTSSNEDTRTENIAVSYTEEDEVLRKCIVSYRDNYISSRVSDNEYRMHIYDGGSFAFNLLPYRY